ncbi:A/G-specific adenine glycosylase [Eikenella sp. S3360]|uniref:Adenine DNA glycosylase n=1 Tax=Eikenella glucosivorans TaxID=2766967 RepID=A0ABS0NDK7_9NEIS|nr:A/G-specific adenine glycosylase [Eikenella glucosivorans]MBH5330342.1 A/G-specific adenine glycosylase [Eikenella glucosivorans]
MSMTSDFARRLVCWQRKHGRHGLPWQVREPYAVWLSEIMLQQTQVATVLDYYPRFLAAFPDVAALAAADEDAVLALWAGLGYYSRARNLHAAAKQVVHDFGGSFPDTREGLETLKGVGRSTAAAVAAFAFGRREAILDGNVKRVLCRVFAQDGEAGDKKFEAELWRLAESLLPEAEDMTAYTQGLMDLGALVCKRSKPDCAACPMAEICLAKWQGRIAELPRRKAAAAVKEVALYWLVLRNRQGRVWLEKRPAGGIWGGLYCVPCFERLDNLYAYAAAFGVAAEDLSEGKLVSHRLTHRLLQITPLQAEGMAADSPDSSIGGLWADPAEYGLPKPLAGYLRQF